MNWLAVIPWCDYSSLKNQIKLNLKQTTLDVISFHLTTNCNTWHVIAVCGLWALGELWTNMFILPANLAAIEE